MVERIVIIAITTMSSIIVKPYCLLLKKNQKECSRVFLDNFFMEMDKM